MTRTEQMEQWLASVGRILDDSLNEIYVFEAETWHFIQANRGARANIGYSLEELRQLTPLDVQPDLTRQRFSELLRPLRAGQKQKVQFTADHRRKDGSRYSVEAHVQLAHYESRPAYVAVVLDVTERERAEEALRHSEARLRAILDAAVDAIITIDERGMVQSVNPAVERLFGYSAGELLGQNISVLMPSPYREEHDRYLEDYFRTGRSKIIGVGREVEARRKDGTIFPVSIAVSEICDGDRLFTGIIRDITELKEAQRRLLQSERLAAIGQMVTGLTHESRNALQRSQACLEMLEVEVGDRPQAANLVARIQKAQEHLHQLYEEVREYAAPIKLDRQPCDLAGLWRMTWSDLELAREGKEVHLCEHTEVANPRCYVDAFSIGQVFRNILENAISACRQPGEITIRCREATYDHQPAFEITVCDNGPGIAPQLRERVFEPFYTTKTKGTGLGMAIAQRIVEAHRGRIAIGDAPDGGAAFVITLPRGEL